MLKCHRADRHIEIDGVTRQNVFMKFLKLPSYQNESINLLIDARIK